LNLCSHNDLGDDSGKNPGCHGHCSEGPGTLALETPLAKKTDYIEANKSLKSTLKFNLTGTKFSKLLGGHALKPLRIGMLHMHVCFAHN